MSTKRLIQHETFGYIIVGVGFFYNFIPFFYPTLTEETLMYNAAIAYVRAVLTVFLFAFSVAGYAQRACVEGGVTYCAWNEQLAPSETLTVGEFVPATAADIWPQLVDNSGTVISGATYTYVQTHFTGLGIEFDREGRMLLRDSLATLLGANWSCTVNTAAVTCTTTSIPRVGATARTDTSSFRDFAPTSSQLRYGAEANVNGVNRSPSEQIRTIRIVNSSSGGGGSSSGGAIATVAVICGILYFVKRNKRYSAFSFAALPTGDDSYLAKFDYALQANHLLSLEIAERNLFAHSDFAKPEVESSARLKWEYRF